MKHDNQTTLASALRRLWTVSPAVAEVGLFVLLSFLLVYKIYLMSPAAIEPLYFSVLHHDAMVLGIALILYAVASFLMRNAALFAGTLLFRAGILLVAALYVLDVAAYKFFSTRLYWADLVVFSSETEGNLSLVKVALERLLRKSWWKVVIVLSSILLALYFAATFIARPTLLRQRYGFAALSIGIAFCLFSLVRFPPSVYSYVDKPRYENVFERNSDYFNRKVFSSEFRDNVVANFDDDQICAEGKGEKRDIVLLIVESLSAHHSKLLSGINDFTPKIDEIARDHTVFTNFHANSWTTIGGLISILTTSWPLVPENAEFNTWGSPRLEYFASPRESLPNYLRSEGYKTTFLAGGDLSFTNKGQWLDTIGFENIVSGFDIDYTGSIRGPFNSVPDGVLLTEAARYVNAFHPDEPELLVIETFWGHRPWISPSPEYRDTEEGTFRYIDASVHDFYTSIADSGFLQSGGLLIIVGDHRSMTPFTTEEIERFGASAASRTIMIVAGDGLGLPPTIDADFQQHDIIPSIAALTADKYCRSSYAGVFLGETLDPPSCIFHSRGDDRDLVRVQCGDKDGDVLIDGDNTRVTEGNLGDIQHIIDKINYERARP